ncbi:Transposase, MuDR, plant [Corchorus capsularis]|uniref:Transposase, MuDR, plant n=1 Tax=Corchorus capsularis TaxID=210143 RepID=A0A1R3J314_COCAP|nr:Transposase, MuDR, plant [Corchorus capsularis]
MLYLRHGFRLEDGLRKIYSDESAMDMYSEMLPRNFIEVYIEHGIEGLDVMLELPAPGDDENEPFNDGGNGHGQVDQVQDAVVPDAPDEVVDGEVQHDPDDVQPAQVEEVVGLVEQVVQHGFEDNRGGANVAAEVNGEANGHAEQDAEYAYFNLFDIEVESDGEIPVEGVDPAYYLEVGLGEDSDDEEFVGGRNNIVRELNGGGRGARAQRDNVNMDDGIQLNSGVGGAENVGGEAQDYDDDFFYNEDHFGEVVEEETEMNDDATRRRGQFPVFDEFAEMPYIEKGMLFTNAEQFKRAVSIISVKSRKAVVWVKNHKNWVRGRCLVEGCPWHIYGAMDKWLESFQVKTFTKDHDCGNIYKTPRLSKKILVDLYKDDIREDPFIKSATIIKDVRRKYGFGLSFSMVRRATKEVFDQVIQNYSKEFGMLWDYAEAIRASNPGSTVKLKVHHEEGQSACVFDRFYVCFDALKKGMLDGNRPFIGLDGCWLKSLTKGELLVAVGRDGNNQMYPFAWALVQGENQYTWKWFIELLIEELDIVQDGMGWTVMGDQHKGLDKAIVELLPKAEHRYCARHVYVNFYHRGFKGEEMRQAFWKIAHANTIREYEAAMDELRKKGHLQPRILKKQPLTPWMVKMSVVSLFEEIRRKLMERIAQKIKDCRRWKGNIGPRIWRVIEKNSRIANYCEVVFNGAAGYEIMHGEERFIVNLAEKTCSCRRYTLSGIPCAHAITAIRDRRGKVEDYRSSWFHSETYLRVYGHVLQPMTGRLDWPKAPGNQLPIKPPPYRRIPGRPVTARRKKPDEPSRDQDNNPNLSRKGQIQTCTMCRQRGHNKRACRNNDRMEKQSEGTENRGSNTPSSNTNRSGGNSTRGRGKRPMSDCHQASATAGARVPTSAQAPATATATVTTPASAPQNATQAQAKKAKPKKKALPKFLTMPAPTGRCWQDEAGNFHGLKHGRSSPASMAKLKKSQSATQPAVSDLSSRSGTQTQAPLRRSPRNMNKTTNMDLNKANQSKGAKRKADDVVTSQGSQASSSKGKKSFLFLFLFQISSVTKIKFHNIQVIERPSADSNIVSKLEAQFPTLHYPKPETFSRGECTQNPVRFFAILSMQRSGSGWFETLLNSHINTLERVYNLDWFTSASKNECFATVGFKWMLNQVHLILLGSKELQDVGKANFSALFGTVLSVHIWS